jgi:hypothetical protein
MLNVCSTPECTTIVFGRGTCVNHDAQHSHLADILLDEAGARWRASSPDGEVEQRQA